MQERVQASTLLRETRASRIASGGKPEDFKTFTSELEKIARPRLEAPPRKATRKQLMQFFGGLGVPQLHS